MSSLGNLENFQDNSLLVKRFFFFVFTKENGIYSNSYSKIVLETLPNSTAVPSWSVTVQRLFRLLDEKMGFHAPLSLARGLSRTKNTRDEIDIGHIGEDRVEIVCKQQFSKTVSVKKDCKPEAQLYIVSSVILDMHPRFSPLSAPYILKGRAINLPKLTLNTQKEIALSNFWDCIFAKR